MKCSECGGEITKDESVLKCSKCGRTKTSNTMDGINEADMNENTKDMDQVLTS